MLVVFNCVSSYKSLCYYSSQSYVLGVKPDWLLLSYLKNVLGQYNY